MGEVLLHAELGVPLPAGVGLDQEGQPTRDARAALLGGVLLSVAIKATGCRLWCRPWASLPAQRWPAARCRIMGFYSSRSTLAC